MGEIPANMGRISLNVGALLENIDNKSIGYALKIP
jgi:hypothetical protein